MIDNIIFDGTNIEYRTYFIARKAKRENNLGERVELVDKFLESFYRIVLLFEPNNIYCCWDTKLDREKPNFRQTTLEGSYKAGRAVADDIQDMFDQQDLLWKVLSAFGVRNMFPKKLEADDVVGWLSKKLEGNTVIISTDRDLYQLVNENVSLYNLKKHITHFNFKDITGLTPDQFLLYKCIKGDPSDNIKGISGYGDVRSKRLALNWDKITLSPEYMTIIERNQSLIDLTQGYKQQDGEEIHYEEQHKGLSTKKGNFDEFKNLLIDHEIKDSRAVNEWKTLFKRNTLVDIINSLT